MTDISAFKGVEPTLLDLATLTLDPAIQPRAGLDEDTVLEYVEAQERDETFPPLLAVETSTDLLLIDGWHRVEAAKRRGVDRLPTRIVRGSREVAIEISAQCNARHGRPRSAADLGKVLAMLIALPRWKQATDASLAAHCRVSRQALQRARSSILPKLEQDTEAVEKTEGGPQPQAEETRIVQRGDQRYEMRTGKIGHQRQDADKSDVKNLTPDEPPPTAPADVGAGMRKLQQRADISDLSRMRLLWGNLSEANRSRFFDETVRPWLDEMEREDAIERT